jgi:hypothetical protein
MAAIVTKRLGAVKREELRSVEPLMPIDYAIGVGTFVPNNAVIIHEDAVASWRGP